MKSPEAFFITSPDPNFNTQDFARIEANGPNFPKDAIIDVVTDKNVLTFAILLKRSGSDEYALNLVDAVPPLPKEIPMGSTVEGDILKKSQEFRLRSRGAGLAGQAFKAISIWANVEIIHL